MHKNRHSYNKILSQQKQLESWQWFHNNAYHRKIAGREIGPTPLWAMGAHMPQIAPYILQFWCTKFEKKKNFFFRTDHPKTTALELGVCNPSLRNYCSNPFEIFTKKSHCILCDNLRDGFTPRLFLQSTYSAYIHILSSNLPQKDFQITSAKKTIVWAAKKSM